MDMVYNTFLSWSGITYCYISVSNHKSGSTSLFKCSNQYLRKSNTDSADRKSFKTKLHIVKTWNYFVFRNWNTRPMFLKRWYVYWNLVGMSCISHFYIGVYLIFLRNAKYVVIYLMCMVFILNVRYWFWMF